MNGTASEPSVEMGTGIRAEIKLDGLDSCPVARTSRAGGDVTSVSRAVPKNGDDVVTEEFTVETDGTSLPVEETFDDDDVEKVFGYDDRSVYRFWRDTDRECFCDQVERHDCTVQDISAEDGGLHVTFYALDVDALSDVMNDLRGRYGNVSVKRLARTGDGNAGDPTFIDCAALTDRQREILTTAYEMGYFEYPKDANAGDVAEALGIARSTLVEHLSTAQSKVLGELVDS